MATEQDRLQQKKAMMRRYSYVVSVFIIVFVVFLYKICSIIFIDGEKWRAKLDAFHNDSSVVMPERGNIYDCNGRLLASTLPTYRLYMDMGADGLTSELFYGNVNQLATELSKFYGDMSPSAYKNLLVKGYRVHSHWYKINSKELSYSQKKQVETFPLFNIGNSNKSGLNWLEMSKRAKPFGSLASRTIGSVKADSGKSIGICGLELSLNSELTGKPGLGSIEKRGGRRLRINDIDPINGVDINSTLDIEIQDIADNALRKQLSNRMAEKGCAIVMDVESGEVKACVNLRREKDGSFTEAENYAVNQLIEPGSTFKTATVMVALDDGVIDTSTVFDTGNGLWKTKYDVKITDHNIKYEKDGSVSSEGGYGRISVAKAIWFSSNIGMAKMVDTLYGEHPKDFVDKLLSLGLARDLKLQIPGAARPKFTVPGDKEWRKYATPLSLSYGYTVQIPPIYTLTFYNGIANGGKMISPTFVHSLSQNGREIDTGDRFKSFTVNSKLCSNSTLEEIQQMLKDVVEKGTGVPFKSKFIKFAGKTGTAQSNYWQTNDKSKIQHRHSFCGYFPADKPKYSCIVVVWNPQIQGYSPAGLAFRDIAEQTYARTVNRVIPSVDGRENYVMAPTTKNGRMEDVMEVIKELSIPYTQDENTEDDSWAVTSAGTWEKGITVTGKNYGSRFVPSVVGMGAKDALYLLESRGMRVTMDGRGHVVGQSIAAGTEIAKYRQTIHLQLGGN